MSPHTVFRAVAVTTAAAALSFALASSAQAAMPGSAPLPIRTPAATSADSPFDGIGLSGLHAEQRTMWPAGTPVRYWALVLNADVADQEYAGGTFFLYAPATGESGWFLDTDIPQRSVATPSQVVIASPEFVKAHPRTEVRYGDPDRPEQARIVATTSASR